MTVGTDRRYDELHEAGIAAEMIDDWPAAEDALRRAIELRPDRFAARRTLAAGLRSRGEHREAFEVSRVAVERSVALSTSLDSGLLLEYALAAFEVRKIAEAEARAGGCSRSTVCRRGSVSGCGWRCAGAVR